MKNLKITVNGIAYDVQVEEVNGTFAAAPVIAPAPQYKPVPMPRPVAAPVPVAAAPIAPVPVKASSVSAAKPSGNAETVESPLPGNVMSINVKPGDSVKAGQVLLMLEAMKMENEIVAPHDATIKNVCVNKGDTVDAGAPLVIIC
ncbi:biotin/lipoyl-containing protein [Caproicibacterium sp. BJN0003]|uniref:biotin/lipoyl-containing protein n=1 Tax=Caproicibacterium sp. BJN0003 TaxID=2994078 RepID=UPI0022564648|nr:biotin/lipoyl-containing protein [Caproicibacterium sp. BJN0003]UZT83340.1 biotin/lipoyl-binding protein [Caproicibacterium sp. BJN0003]